MVDNPKAGQTQRYRRSIRRFLINPKFQLSFLAYFAVFCQLNILVIYVSVIYAWNSMVDRAVDAHLSATPATLQFFESSKGMLTSIFLVGSLESLVVLLLGGIFISHRVAGPLHQIQGALRRIAGGEYPMPVKFRELDYFDEIQDAYNAAIHRLTEHGLPSKGESRK